MKALLDELPPLQAALNSAVLALSQSAATPTAIDRYIKGLRRRCTFARLHLRVLRGVDWKLVDGLGRDNASTDERAQLSIPLEDASLILHHPGAVADHVYVAFDGAVAAAANLTDTFGRLVNATYGLGLQERQANLLEVQRKCTPSGALGRVLHDPRHHEWLKCVKDLRGRCQHADIEGVLLIPGECYAARSEPCVPSAYCWTQPQTDLPASRYAALATDAAQSTLVAAIRAIVSSAANPLA